MAGATIEREEHRRPRVRYAKRGRFSIAYQVMGGTGLSDRVSPDALPPLEERMEDVLAVMDATDSERAVLFGTLGGGATCCLLAATYQDSVVDQIQAFLAQLRPPAPHEGTASS